MACTLVRATGPETGEEALMVEGTNHPAAAGASAAALGHLAKGTCQLVCRRGTSTLWKDQVRGRLRVDGAWQPAGS